MRTDFERVELTANRAEQPICPDYQGRISVARWRHYCIGGGCYKGSDRTQPSITKPLHRWASEVYGKYYNVRLTMTRPGSVSGML